MFLEVFGLEYIIVYTALFEDDLIFNVEHQPTIERTIGDDQRTSFSSSFVQKRSGEFSDTNFLV